MGLFGSEYWTYSLPKRVGKTQAERLTNDCLPLLGEEAAELGLVDFSLPRDQIDHFIYQELIPNWNYDQVREKKWINSVKPSDKPLEAYR